VACVCGGYLVFEASEAVGAAVGEGGANQRARIKSKMTEQIAEIGRGPRYGLAFGFLLPDRSGGQVSQE
jgi:hypothetical protein